MKAVLCNKCNMRWALQETGIYPLCYICFLKSKKIYSSAIKTIRQTDWWNYKTGICKLRVGWSFVENLYSALLFAAVMNCNSLNRRPRCPEVLHKTDAEALKLLGESDWRISTAENYYGGRK